MSRPPANRSKSACSPSPACCRPCGRCGRSPRPARPTARRSQPAIDSVFRLDADTPVEVYGDARGARAGPAAAARLFRQQRRCARRAPAAPGVRRAAPRTPLRARRRHARRRCRTASSRCRRRRERLGSTHPDVLGALGDAVCRHRQPPAAARDGAGQPALPRPGRPSSRRSARCCSRRCARRCCGASSAAASGISCSAGARWSARDASRHLRLLNAATAWARDTPPIRHNYGAQPLRIPRSRRDVRQPSPA